MSNMLKGRKGSCLTSMVTLILLLIVYPWLQANCAPAISFYDYVVPTPKLPTLHLHTTVNIPANITSLTTCFHLYISGSYTEMVLIMNLNGLLQIGLYGKSLVRIDVRDSISHMATKWEMRKWSHVCITQGATNHVLINGEIKEMSIVSRYPYVFPSGNLTLGIGATTEMVTSGVLEIGSFVISPPKVFTRLLNISEVSSLQRCEDDLSGNLVVNSWTEERFFGELTSNYSQVLSLVEPPSVNRSRKESAGGERVEVISAEYCFPVKQYFYFIASISEPSPSKIAMSTCHKLNGTLPSELDQNLSSNIIDLFYPQNPFVIYWLQEVVNATHCKKMTIDQEYRTKIHEIECVGPYALYIICKIATGTSLNVYGDTIDEETEVIYPASCLGGGGCYFTKQMSSIALDSGNSYTFKDARGSWAYSTTLKAGMLTPIGRNKWTLDSGNRTVELVITSCSQGEFTCDDGLCIPLEKHCDGIPDCDGFSDEACNFTLPLTAWYDNKRPYNQRIPLDVNVNIDRVPIVDVDRGIIQLLLKLETRWSDDRIRFIQLQNDWSRNPIYIDAWEPTYTLERTIFSESIEYNHGTNVIKKYFAVKNNSGDIMIHESREKRLFGGYLMRQERVSFSFHCFFDLQLYPFGMHRCNFNLSIAGNDDMAPRFQENGVIVKMDSLILSRFVASKVRFDMYPEGNESRTVQIQILLDSLFGGYIFSTFMPCYIIGTIGTLTLLFAYTQFQDRIMVTLSCLIVEAGLYSQINSNSPASSSPKAVDKFFFFNIVRLFLVCVLHTINYRWLAYLKNKETEREEFTETKSNNISEDGYIKKILEASIKQNPIPTTKETRNNGSLILNVLPTYYDPCNKNIQMNTWTNTDSENCGLKSYMRKFKFFNHVVFILYILSEIAFITLFIFDIMSQRNNVLHQFDDAE